MTPAPADFEKDWLCQAADGDRHAFTNLYTRYLDSLYQYVFLFTRSAYSTEEIVQDVFVRIWEHRESLREVESFKSYLFRAAKNRVIDYVRSQEVVERALSRLLADKKADPETPDEAFDYKVYYHIVQEAIGQLSPRKQEIFRLSTEKGLSHDEIAAELDISKSSVKNQLYKSFEFIREYLNRKGGLSFVLTFLLFAIREIL
ncbi:MAG: RNA polymerase sigma-70 factor [Bacteroidota bacterium]|nr:RNA polymerase sigma-70 factor [Bacteroidota bacterium]MDP4212302.1 RNA polymerase sigma-70 factor [Bacteroidota bacterium]